MKDGKDTRPKKSENKYRLEDALDYKNNPQKVKSASKKGKKRRNPYGLLIALLALSMSVVIGIVLLIVFRDKEGISDSDINGNVLQSEGGVQIPNHISINMNSFTAVVGENYKLEVSSYPEDMMEAALWSSNNSSVVSVDQEGRITANSVGVAAVTVTAGQYADAIAIEVVEEVEKASLGFPSYDIVKENYDYNNTPVLNSDSVVATESTAAIEQGGATSTENGNSAQAEGIGNTASAAQTENSNQESIHQGENETQAQPENAQGSTADIPDVINTADVSEVLAQAGFLSYVSGTFAYYENSSYCGEIIVGDDNVHIYIKDRTAKFDEAVVEVLKYLLPENYNMVWDSFTKATVNKTFISEGRNVRIVLPAENAHSQIIIY